MKVIEAMKILFLHGLGQDKKSWNQTIQKLKCKKVENFNLVSNDVKNQSFDKIANKLELKTIMESNPIIICGLSLGAILGLELYFRQPNKISGLILIAPQYKIPTILIDIQNVILKLIPNKFFSKMGISKNNMISIASSMRRLDYTDRIKNISCPVYIICGSNDKANIKAAKNLKELLPKAHLKFVDDSKHEVNIDKSYELAMIIDRAYQEISQLIF